MRVIAAVCILFSTSAGAFSQAPADSQALNFEVASVKPSEPLGDRRIFSFGGGRGGPGSPDPERLTFTGATLMMLISNAYDVKPYQVNGPAWLESERYDVIAKIPPNTTKEQSGIMLQNLLAERFHLKLRRESKEFQGFELVVGKGGSKLKASSPEDAAYDQTKPPTAPPGPPGRDANGFPTLDQPGLIVMMRMSQRGGMASKLTARAQTIPRLLEMITNQLNKPISDKTGLTGKYDFTLEYAAEMPAGMMLAAGGPPPPPPPPAGGSAAGAGSAGDAPEELVPALPTAIQQQLGLRLDAKKIQLPFLVVEAADKTPTEN